MNEINQILRKTRTDSQIYTHTTLFKKGKYSINNQTREQFWNIYCPLLREEKEPPCLGLAEKVQGYIPILADVDIKIRDEGEEFGEKLYSLAQVKSLIEIYNGVLRSIVDNLTDKDLTCFLLEKPLRHETKNDVTVVKNGFHLHYPYIFLSKLDHELHLIPRVKELVKSEKIFENLGFEDSSTIIDANYVNTTWMVYGCVKNEGAKPFLVTKIFDHNTNEISINKALENYTIKNYRGEIINIRNDPEFYLPRVLSVISADRQTKELKRGIISPMKEKLRREKKSNPNTDYQDMSKEETLNIIKRLLPMIANWRADEEGEWIRMGWILHSITDGDIEGLELWSEFSARNEDKYDENVCTARWAAMTKKCYTLGTLRHYAGIDSPEEYAKFKEERTNKHISASLEGSHNDIAKAMFEEYGERFVCASINNQLWFEYKNHKWEQVECGFSLSNKISGSFVAKYCEAGKQLYSEMAECDDSGNKSKVVLLQSKLKSINKMVSNLKNNGYKRSIMKESMEVFYNPRFLEKLDTDPYLIGFKNGVYDLANNVFRSGNPEDYLSKCIPWEYKLFSYADEGVGNVNTFLEQVFPDKSIRKYFMDITSDLFVGGNLQKTVTFWTGEGDNGKSITQTIIEKMFGKLAVKMNTNNLTGKKPSPGQAYADLSRTGGGVRMVVLEEPEGDESIGSGSLKYLSGNDTFYVRDLYEKGKDGKEIDPLFKIIFICNKLPPIRNADKAVWNRVRVLPFESTFCANPPESEEEQLYQKRFPMDKNFKQKIPSLIEPFIWMLLEHRKTISNEVRVEPPKVLSATQMYQRQNDIYKQFIEENIVQEGNKSMLLAEIYAIFKVWFREGFPNLGLPNRPDLEEHLKKILGAPLTGKKWKGIRQRTIADDKEDEKEAKEEEDRIEATEKELNLETEELLEFEIEIPEEKVPTKKKKESKKKDSKKESKKESKKSSKENVNPLMS